VTVPRLPWLDAPDRPIVVAFGGNALLPDPDDPTGAEARANAFAAGIGLMVPENAGVILVHGNGPQVGTLLLRTEATRDALGSVPLDVLVAETQGSIGYLLARALRNSPAAASRSLDVATVVTQVVVDPTDPAMTNPTKPVGPFYPPKKGAELAAAAGWSMVDVPNRGVRRVVPSPRPYEVVELHAILDAALEGDLVIAGGGGGIPVRRDPDGTLGGVEAVIDKDRTAALIATSADSSGFVILTEVGHAATSFGTPEERPRVPTRVDGAQDRVGGPLCQNHRTSGAHHLGRRSGGCTRRPRRDLDHGIGEPLDRSSLPRAAIGSGSYHRRACAPPRGRSACRRAPCCSRVSSQPRHPSWSCPRSSPRWRTSSASPPPRPPNSAPSREQLPGWPH
jgi:carbamate kinase